MLDGIEIAYISGPMRGLPNFNHQRFFKVKSALRLQFPDLYVYNPAENFGGDTTLDVATYMTLDITQVLHSQALVLLPDWWQSEGARLEVEVALITGKRFFAATEAEGNTAWRFSELADWEVRARLSAGKSDAGIVDDGVKRTFGTGATRDTSVDKLDYEGFLSPAVLEAFAKYMHKHRKQADGTVRSADNWQKGMPLEVYMSSMWRHFMDVWKCHRGLPIAVSQVDALMALLFNVQGYAFELLRGRE